MARDQRIREAERAVAETSLELLPAIEAMAAFRAEDAELGEFDRLLNAEVSAKVRWEAAVRALREARAK
jgi:hypothetical protein